MNVSNSANSMILEGAKLVSKDMDSSSHIIVLLHGYGASGDSLIPVAHHWKNKITTKPILFVSPNAPETCDKNSSGYQWFALPDFDFKTIKSGIEKARPILLSYLKELLETYNLTESDLTLIGFSQGTIMALDLMFFMPDVKCVVGYSGAFYPPEETTNHPKTNVLLVHGTNDFVVPYVSMANAERHLKQFQVFVTTYTCQGLDHSISAEGLNVGGKHLLKCLE
ncbi:MAG: alpha/beta hydrolase [Alphaproteobacteria bacterium]